MPRPPLPPGKDPVRMVQKAGWAPEPVWRGGISRHHRDSIPDRPARSSVVIPTELPGPLLTYYLLLIFFLNMNLTISVTTLLTNEYGKEIKANYSLLAYKSTYLCTCTCRLYIGVYTYTRM